MSEYTSHAVGNAGLATGIIGTALGVLNGGAGLLGIMPNAQKQEYVTKEALDMAMTIAAKDSEIALLKSEQNTEIKIADVYERLATKINANQREQDAINREQAVYNGVNTASLGCLKNQVEQLMSLTALRIPNTSVCPGWGAVTITPTAPTVVATTPSGAA